MPTSSSSAQSSFPVVRQLCFPSFTNNSISLFQAYGLRANSLYSFGIPNTTLASGFRDLTQYTYQPGQRTYIDSSSVKLRSNANGELSFYCSPLGVVNIAASFRLFGPDNRSVTPSASSPPTPPSPQPGTTSSSTSSSGTTRPPVPNTVTTSTILSTQQVVTTSPVNRSTVSYNGGTPLSETSLYFDYIQTFYIDPASVEGSQTVMLNNVELFFKQRPHRTNNQSGINNPGVRICICEVENDQPNLRKVYRESLVVKNYDDIFPSLDANTPTTFAFRSPFAVRTGKQYGIVVNFGDPQYSLWVATQNSYLLGTTTRLSSSNFTSGKLYRASNYLEIDASPDTLDALFRAIPESDLKFTVNINRFTTNTKTIEMVNADYEFLTIDSITEGPLSTFFFGERIYQKFGNTSANVTFYSPGTISITKNSIEITGSNTNFLSSLEAFDTIVITDAAEQNIDVRTISNITNNTYLTLTEPVNFTNSTAKYFLTAIGSLYSSIPSTNTLILSDSTADARKRFIKDGVNYITWTSGTGYSNTDYIIFTGGTANGRATITTNTTGHIASLNITDPGYGFSSAPVATVYQANGSLRTPSPSTITVTPGSQLFGELSKATTSVVNVSVFPVNDMIPNLRVNSRGLSIGDPRIDFSYSSGNNYLISASNFQTLAGENSVSLTSYNATLVSKSLELLNQSTLNIAEGKSSVIRFDLSGTNRYESPELYSELSYMYLLSNQINSDATNEHTNNGNAISRHITTKITFDRDRFAEDVRVIASMYKPLNTDVKFYAKIHNSKDEDAFDDKDWSELEAKSATFGDRFYSSSTNPNDLVEITYGFRQYPRIIKTLAGAARVYNSPGNTTVDGIGTTFNADIANGDIVVLYDPNFANVTYAVAAVANTPVATSFSISQPLANDSLAAATLKVGVVSNSTISYAFNAFNNILNDNVVRYYSTSKNEFDTYDSLSIKIVLNSNSSYLVPRVESVTAIGVSA